MKKAKLFGIGFSLSFVLNSTLSLFFDMPLVFIHDYGINQFLILAILLGFLVIAMIFLNYPLLIRIKRKVLTPVNDFAFYIISTLVLLQIVTLIAGYMESALTRGYTADFLFYYKGITNSYIYIFSGNLTALITTYIFVKDIKIQGSS